MAIIEEFKDRQLLPYGHGELPARGASVSASGPRREELTASMVTEWNFFPPVTINKVRGRNVPGMQRPELALIGIITLALVLGQTGCQGSSSSSSKSSPSPKPGLQASTQIVIAPLNPSIPVGADEQFSAREKHSDGTSEDVTNKVTWTSSDPTLVAIESSDSAFPGKATAIAAGSVTITASLDSTSGSTGLAVVALFNATPLMDMPELGGTCLTYKNFPGGLYENCSNTLPNDHDADGKMIATEVQPLDTSGSPNPSGKIVFVSIGMSAALDEFAPFVTMAEKSTAVNNTTVALLNGAASLQDACYWFPAEGPPSCDPTAQNNYDRIESQMASSGRGLTSEQIQIAWIDEENGRVHAQARGCQPLGTECVPLCDETISGCSNTPDTTDALNLEQEFGKILRAAKQRWPNLKVVFFNSRIFGGYAINTNVSASPEPFAYESAFSVKWLIEAQINQIRTGTVDPMAGDLSYGVAPWIAWGPYTWASGPIRRSDGLIWCNGQPDAPCSSEVDFDSDGVHPNVTGATKVSNMLMTFFLNSSYTNPWFAVH